MVQGAGLRPGRAGWWRGHSWRRWCRWAMGTTGGGRGGCRGRIALFELWVMCIVLET